MFGLDFGLSVLLLLCLLSVCAFEFINGFHDTANAVATVIYTNSLKPRRAVVLSGVLNGVGVFVGGTTVAMGIINLLPVETLVDQNITHSLGMVGAILLTAIFWNLLTWMMAIPASSSHTLVGSILGVGIAYSLLPGTGDAAVNWHKAGEVGMSLLISPMFGFMLAFALLSLCGLFASRASLLYQAPQGDAPPPWSIRSILIGTCSLVSFSHGSNDGQKGIGLMMLILIGIVPAKFAIDERYTNQDVAVGVAKVNEIMEQLQTDRFEDSSKKILEHARQSVSNLQALSVSSGSAAMHITERFEIRKNLLLLQNDLKKLAEHKDVAGTAEFHKVQSAAGSLKKFTNYAPAWVVILIALSLGIGTMIGWKRIVVTIGEKIGKTHLTYGQGASAEVVAASTIAVSTYLGLPVSTTHVLSSGIAGSMYASGGIANLEKGTISKIVLAWILTFPVCLTMSGTLFLIFRSLAG